MEGRDLLSELEKDYEDTCSILNNNNLNGSDINDRYNIQHLEGSSEENSQDGSDNEEVDQGEYGYAALEEDEEFGDFKGFEDDPKNDDSEFLSSNRRDKAQELYPLPGAKNDKKSERNNQNEQNVSQDSTLPPPPSIPPLTQDKIDKIKMAMSKISIKPPPIGTAELLKEFDRCTLRLGDEITQNTKK